MKVKLLLESKLRKDVVRSQFTLGKLCVCESMHFCGFQQHFSTCNLQIGLLKTRITAQETYNSFIQDDSSF